jgi:hypothetical protein
MNIGIGGSGYYFLLVSLIVFSIIFILKVNLFTIKFGKSFLPLLIFLFYFVVKVSIDLDNLQEVKSATIGTSGGVIFAFAMGLMFSFFISFICKQIYIDYKNINFYFIIFLFVISFYLFDLSRQYSYFFNYARSDLFILVRDFSGLYQRPADLMIMEIMLLFSLTVIFFNNCKNRKLLFICLFLTIILSFQSSIFSQLLGSNKGFVLSIAMLFLILFFMYMSKISSSCQKAENNVTILKFLLNKNIFFLLIFIFIVFIFLLYLIQGQVHDFNTLRISGFGSGYSSSFWSRVDIFKDNFMTHFAYSPLFGFFAVDSVTTGSGTYVHSLISILTHLGIVGFCFFIFYVIRFYFESKITNKFMNTVFQDNIYLMFMSLGFTIFLGFGLIGCFMTWMPFWFGVGLWGVKYNFLENKFK